MLLQIQNPSFFFVHCSPRISFDVLVGWFIGHEDELLAVFFSGFDKSKRTIQPLGDLIFRLAGQPAVIGFPAGKRKDKLQREPDGLSSESAILIVPVDHQTPQIIIVFCDFRRVRPIVIDAVTDHQKADRRFPVIDPEGIGTAVRHRGGICFDDADLIGRDKASLRVRYVQLQDIPDVFSVHSLQMPRDSRYTCSCPPGSDSMRFRRECTQ